MLQQNLKIAIQRSGRLGEPSIELLRKCDISFDNGLGKLRSVARNFPLEVLFLRDDDIPRYIEDGVADIGIVGENVIAESDAQVSVLEKLGFGRCRLALAVPRATPYETPADLSGKRLATSYPRILSSFLDQRAVSAEIHEISGSVEIAPGIGLADGVCDLVSSGNTLFTNGLVEVETIMRSEAVLISRQAVRPEVEDILQRLLFRIRSVIAARNNKYILLNAPDDKLETIEALIPGMKSPTVMPLAKPGWSSVHSVIGDEDYWDVVGRLTEAGAEGILVLNIENMIK